MACAWERGSGGCLCENVMRFRCDTPNSGPSDFLHHIPSRSLSPDRHTACHRRTPPSPRRPQQRAHPRLRRPRLFPDFGPLILPLASLITHFSSHASPITLPPPFPSFCSRSFYPSSPHHLRQLYTRPPSTSLPPLVC
ncbi:hypothetical protein BDQ12DRAFT_197082 [Crucibulum laeve]|uniref:Uncharacterized protein n=1 Tax=Crucibulum laeve TaxID=68775 RepID=A0A5C3MIU0_9AGAR|nr:hypothetical protein BDQ12DRAFT_197082 [Crucibulum laeve]